MERILIMCLVVGENDAIKFDKLKYSLGKFCPGVPKTISMISDKVSTANMLMNPHTLSKTNMPRCILRALKFHYIRDMMDRAVNMDFTHAFYIDNDIRFIGKVPTTILTDGLTGIVCEGQLSSRIIGGNWKSVYKLSVDAENKYESDINTCGLVLSTDFYRQYSRDDDNKLFTYFDIMNDHSKLTQENYKEYPIVYNYIENNYEEIS